MASTGGRGGAQERAEASNSLVEDGKEVGWWC